MRRFLRHHAVRLLRLPALAVLLLAVLANPVLATMGDLYEMGRGGEHLHAVTDHDGQQAHADEEGEGSLLHALMHASHCCGHLTAIVPQTVVPLSLWSPQTVAVTSERLSPARRLEPLFRPPIAA